MKANDASATVAALQMPAETASRPSTLGTSAWSPMQADTISANSAEDTIRRLNLICDLTQPNASGQPRGPQARVGCTALLDGYSSGASRTTRLRADSIQTIRIDPGRSTVNGQTRKSPNTVRPRPGSSVEARLAGTIGSSSSQMPRIRSVPTRHIRSAGFPLPNLSRPWTSKHFPVTRGSVRHGRAGSGPAAASEQPSRQAVTIIPLRIAAV
jgi:hypothetical protein